MGEENDNINEVMKTAFPTSFGFDQISLCSAQGWENLWKTVNRLFADPHLNFSLAPLK